MVIHFRKCGIIASVVFAVVLAALPVSATIIQESRNFGSNLGELTYEEIITTSGPLPCGDLYYIQTSYYYLDFVYIDSQGASQAISGETYYIPGVSGCSTTQIGPTINYAGTGYTITIQPGIGGVLATINVPGYINLKYIVVGINYAPPGGVVSGGVAKGNVSYTDSNLVSSTITSKTSFGSSYTESNVVTLPSVGFDIMGWAAGSVSGSSSSSYTSSTTTTDSTAVTAQKMSGTVLGVNGPTCPYVGVDHDYDQIGVWLNPVQLFTLTNGGVVQPNGYGYSTLDQPGMDIYWVYVGELNGDLPVRSSTTTAFARAWWTANGEPTWPSGPGLTSQDEQNILQMDQYWDCTYESPWTNAETSPCAKPPNATYFTESAGDQSFPYTQPEVGASPNFQAYTLSYTTTDTQGADAVYTTSQTFGLETKFSGSLFGFGFSDTLSLSQTITHSYETSSQFTSSNTTTATATIWQPPCNVVDGACSPVYPPSNAYNPISCTAISSLNQAFGQGYTMYIYQDNLFGTFLMEPYGQ